MKISAELYAELDDKELLALEYVNKLPDRERQIIEMRFGLNNSPPMTFAEIGKKLKLCRQRINVLCHETLTNIRRFSKTPGTESEKKWIERAVDASRQQAERKRESQKQSKLQRAFAALREKNQARREAQSWRKNFNAINKAIFEKIEK